MLSSYYCLIIYNLLTKSEIKSSCLNNPPVRQVGLWYEHDGNYIHGYFFSADGNGWKGEWRVGSREEHRAFTWKVEGNRLSTYSPNGGDQMDDFVYSISADGKTLTLTSPRSGSVKGVFQRQ